MLPHVGLNVFVVRVYHIARCCVIEVSRVPLLLAGQLNLGDVIQLPLGGCPDRGIEQGMLKLLWYELVLSLDHLLPTMPPGHIINLHSKFPCLGAG